MSNLLACRVCLATDEVKLYSMNTLNLMHSYEMLTGFQILFEDQLPQHICTFCSALLTKSVAFKNKCFNSQEILITAGQQGRLTLDAIRDINQPHRHPYSTAYEQCTMTIDTTMIKQEIKIEEEERVHKKSKKKKKVQKVEVEVKVEDEVNHDHDYVNYESDSQIEPVFEIRGLELQTINIPDAQIQDRELKDVEIVFLSKKEQKQEIEKRKTSSNYLDSYYKCDQCYKGFITEPTLRNHMTYHDPERGPHACDVCRSHWSCTRALRAHTLNTHERKYMCKLCDHVSRSSHRAKEHSKWHSGFSFICKTCGASFAKSTSYLTHMRLQHPSNNSCELCGESFVGEFGLRMHKKKSHYPVGTAQCDHCEVKFESRDALVRHLEVTRDERCDIKRSCTHCGEGFDSDECLREHLKTHEKNEVCCEECKLTFSSASSYATHYQRVHLGLKLKQQKPRSYKKPVDSHVCEICGKKCISKATLMYHQRIHTGETPFHCTECPKKFSVHQRLQNHRRGHSGERPHRCRECGKGFILNEQLKIHQRIHTGETPYQCKSCPKTFKHKAALNRHDRVHTGAKPYSCPHCSKSFSQSNSMKLHVSTVHLKLPAPYRARRNKI